MKRITNIFAGLLILLFSAQFVNAQSTPPPTTGPCDPCAGQPWSSYTYLTPFTFFLSSPAGCPFKAYVRYKTRYCMGRLQVEVDWDDDVYIETPPGSGCNIHCINVPEIMKNIYVQIQGANGNVAIWRSLPSPCYYTGTITVPAAARVCFGMVPGSTVNVLVPCDPNGCCYSELVHVTTPSGPSYIQNVFAATPCPSTPVIPPSHTINWGCDILGGGAAYFVVPFVPDSPLTCETICMSGLAKADPTAVDELDIKAIVSNLKIYPNPVEDNLTISFSIAEDNTPVKIELFDISGRTVVSQEHKSVAGSQTITVDMTSLPHGSYGLRLSYKEETITTKIAK